MQTCTRTETKEADLRRHHFHSLSKEKKKTVESNRTKDEGVSVYTHPITSPGVRRNHRGKNTASLYRIKFQGPAIPIHKYRRYSRSSCCCVLVARGGLLLSTPAPLTLSGCRKAPKCCGEVGVSPQNTNKMTVIVNRS